ncbi:MAG: 3-methyl-2-oxobutanoate hydroxymethyltransferase [Gemmatimonadota bacterium]
MSSPPLPGGTRPSVRRFAEMKRNGQRIVVLTAYDYTFARLLAAAGVDMLLVGDSLGQVVLGYESTVPVTLDEMIHHAKAVRRGAPNVFTVLDLPFLTYQVSVEQAVANAGRALKETGVHAVKIEGGGARILETVRTLVEIGIPVMGHLGLTPQAVHQLGGHRVQARDEESRARIKHEAQALEAAGCFSLVLELIPEDIAGEISASLSIPTIGIGAGRRCDGQVLVCYDALGLNADFRPRFLKRYADLDTAVREGMARFADEVRDGTFPGPEHTFQR